MMDREDGVVTRQAKRDRDSRQAWLDGRGEGQKNPSREHVVRGVSSPVKVLIMAVCPLLSPKSLEVYTPCWRWEPRTWHLSSNEHSFEVLEYLNCLRGHLIDQLFEAFQSNVHVGLGQVFYKTFAYVNAVDKYLGWISCGHAPIASSYIGLNNIHSVTCSCFLVLMGEVKGH